MLINHFSLSNNDRYIVLINKDVVCTNRQTDKEMYLKLIEYYMYQQLEADENKASQRTITPSGYYMLRTYFDMCTLLSLFT